MKLILELDVNASPPSVNHIYKTGIVNGRQMRYLSKEAQDWYKIVSSAISASEHKRILFSDTRAYFVDIGIKTSWKTKRGTIRKKDIDNRIKVVLDGLVRSLNGFKDETVWKVSASKEHAENGHRTTVKIFELEVSEL